MTKETLKIWYDNYIEPSYPLCNYVFIASESLCIDYKDTCLHLPYEEVKNINLFVSLSSEATMDNNSIHLNITCKSGVYFSVNINWRGITLMTYIIKKLLSFFYKYFG